MGASISRRYRKDLILIVDGQKFYVDKSVLALHSSVFSKMLELERRNEELALSDMDERTMKILIHYMYEQDTTGLDSADIIIRVLIAARMYEMNELKSIAMDKLRDIITNDNAIYVIKLAMHFKNTDVLVFIIGVIVNKGLPIVKSNEMKEIYESDNEIAPLFIRTLYDNPRRVSDPIEIPPRKCVL